jgi:predicted transcriptional regulator
MENEKNLRKLILESTCIVYSILDDYCAVIGKLTATERDSVRKRILEKANRNLATLKEKYTEEVTS